MRTKGMSLMRMPVFTWMVLVIQFLLLFAIPVITVALVLLMFQREFDATFFTVAGRRRPAAVAAPVLDLRPPRGVHPRAAVVRHRRPRCCRCSPSKPLFGYPFVVFSGAAIGFVGWGVWAHHMFASGLGPVSVAVFSVATMAIAIPTGVKIVNWTLTMWGGKLRFTTAMLFAIGLVVEFTIGGLSGVTHSVAPSDTQQTDTYYIVAHFHYVLFGGAVLGFFAGFYYWWPKVFGKCLNEKLGKWNFWLMIIGMNMTFGPMHIIGLQGQPRRMYVWTEARAGEGFFNLGFWNLVVVDRRVHPRHRRAAVPDQRRAHAPQGAAGPARPVGRPHAGVDDDAARRRSTTSTRCPTVHALDEFFHRKYEDVGEGDHHDLQQVATAEEILAEQEAHADHHIHLPSPSYWPIVLAFVAADHRLRRDLQPLHRRRRRRHAAAGRCSAGRWSRRSPTTSDYDPPAPTPTARARSWPRWGAPDGRADDERRAPRPRSTRRPRATAPPTSATSRATAAATPSPRRSTRSRWAACPGPGAAPTVDTGEERTTASPTCPSTTAERDDHGGTPRPPACPTTRWRCGCSSAPSACCSAA